MFYFVNNLFRSESVYLLCWILMFSFLAFIPLQQFGYIAFMASIQVIICYCNNLLNTSSLVLLCENSFFQHRNVFNQCFNAKSAYEILLRQEEADDNAPVYTSSKINQFLEFI